ncbi:hypothetical protein ACSBL2_15860 [Pedobacter sp. AW31-3R]|uniref:hypothetical protein n=1 Tax=Pedobacter sp. AW31-3R TaxID=3445781 RepID=UPI003F9F64B9
MGFYPSLMLTGIISLWLILSILKYFSFAKSWIVENDVLSLIPTWNFFAPEPNQTDYYLYYRVFSAHADSPWRLVSFGAKRKWYGFIWNPYRRDRKSFFDICQLLIGTPVSEKNEVVYTLPYLLLLNHVSTLCKAEIGDTVQFAISMVIPSQNKEELSTAFISMQHVL